MLGVVAVAALSLVPLGYVVVSIGQLGPGEAADFLIRPRIGTLLWNTVRLLVATVGLSALIAVCCAWLVERRVSRLRGLWHGLMCAPLAMPAFVNGYAWVSTTHAVQGFAGAVLVVSLSYYPLIYLPTVAALRRLDPGLEDVGALSQSTRGVVFRVVLPLISPAVLGGSLLVGLHVLAEYGALQLLTYPTLTTSILDQYRSTFNGPAAALLAGVLAVFCLALASFELVVTARVRRARVGAGVARPARMPGARDGAVPHAVLLGVVLLALGVPVASLVRWLVRGSSTALDTSALWSSASSTVGFAATTGLVATAVAAPVAWLAVRHGSWVATVLERCTYLASSLPGIVVALALVTVSLRIVPPLYQTALALVAGYVILFLPRAVVSLRPTIELAEPLLEDVARSLGLRASAVARRVTLPLVLPGVASSIALVALAVSTELTATLLLAPTGTTTLATEFWVHASAVEYGAAAPYALALVLLSVPATWLLSRLTLSSDRATQVTA